MKNLILFLALLLSNIAYGQTNKLPLVVDNIAFFPPARTQQNVPNCSYFSLIYYLKSYEWNKHYNRDPKLEKNQFSHSFAWNQNIDPVYQMSEPMSAFFFMKSQGCATIADFPLTETSTEVQPSIEVKTKALAYRSKRLFQNSFSTPYILSDEQVTERIESLKDSLAQGKCFSLSFRLFDSFMKLSNKNRVFSYYPGTSVDSIRPSHVSTVIGYNDTIKTVSGRGAFIVLDSDTTKVSDGIFYFDYKWFYSGVWSFSYFFLEEDFSSQTPDVVMSLNISGALTGKDIVNFNYGFIDTLVDNPNYEFYSVKKIDFDDYFNYLYNRNQVQVASINKSKIKLRSDLIYFPLNNTDGSYSLVTDLSSINDLKSLSVIVFDPMSASFIGQNNEVIYSYEREATCRVNYANINFLSASKNVMVKVVNLSDTIITTNDFISIEIGNRPGIGMLKAHVKSCTSVLKRKMITFTLEEETAPVFIDPPQTLTTVVNQTLSYTFEAKDNENRPITYYLENTSPEASMTSNGKLTFKSAKIGTYRYTVVASNSLKITTCPVTVKVDLVDAVGDIEVPEVTAKVFPNPMRSNATVELLLSKREAVNIVIYDYLGRQLGVVANDIYEAGEQSINYDAANLISGVYIFKISAGSFQKSIKVVKQ